MDHISVVQCGEHGSSIVLIPGLSTLRDVWNGIVPSLEKTNRLHLVQVNGFAGDDSGSNLGTNLLDGIVADLNAYLSEKVVGQATVIGHSFGGLVAMKLAIAHPQQPRALIIVESLPFVGSMLMESATMDKVEPIAHAMRAKMQALYGQSIDMDGLLRIAAFNALKPSSRDLVATWVRQSDPRVAGQILFEGLTTDLRPELATIDVPVMILYGWSDDTLSQTTADALYRDAFACLRNVRFADVPNAGHFIMLDQPQKFEAEITRFLKHVG